MATFEDFFVELLYGSGSWLAMLLVASIVIGLLLKWKYSALLLGPTLGFMAIAYIRKDLLWQAIILITMMIFSVVYMMKDKLA